MCSEVKEGRAPPACPVKGFDITEKFLNAMQSAGCGVLGGRCEEQIPREGTSHGMNVNIEKLLLDCKNFFDFLRNCAKSDLRSEILLN
jgi:hypothetical protein